MRENSNKTKVLFVITKSNFGGAQKYVFDLATGLSKDRFEAVVTLGGEGALASKLREAFIRTIPLSSLIRDVNPLKDLASFFNLLKLFYSERPDVVHLNSAKASGIGALAARLAGVPIIVFTAHGWAFNEDRPRVSRVAIKILSWMTVVLAHRTIAVSESVRRDTENWPLVRDKISMIHNGISPVDFLAKSDARALLIAKRGAILPHDAILVGTIAELHKNKGLVYAIDAIAPLIKQNPSLFYFILGEGEEREYLQKLIEQREIRDNVFLLGFIDSAASYLPAFDIFLLPSIKEGLPYVLLEAGLAKLPVIASHVGGIPEIINDGKTGFLVLPHDSKKINSALKSLIESPDTRTTFGTTLNERVTEGFSQQITLNETISLYEK